MHIDRNNFLNEIRKGNTKALDYIMETYSALVKGIVTKVLYTLGDNGLVEEIIDLENEDKLLKLINKLEETNRSIFIMKFFLGMSSSEIGKKLNLSSNAVDNRIFRERKKLRNKFYKNEKEEILYENNI